MTNEIIFKIKLTLKDLRAFNLLYLYSGRRGVVMIFATLMISIGLITWLPSVAETGDFDSPTFIFLLCLTFIMIFTPIAMLIKTKKIFASDKFLSEEQNYCVNQRGIAITTSSSQINITWDKVFKVQEHKNHLLIYIAVNKSLVLPKREMGDKLVVLKELFLANIDQAKLKIKSN